MKQQDRDRSRESGSRPARENDQNRQNDRNRQQNEQDDTARRHAQEGRPMHEERSSSGRNVIDEASEESFPASDSPSWTPETSVGRKGRNDR